MLGPPGERKWKHVHAIWPQSKWRGGDSICTEKIQQNVDSGCIIKVKSSFSDFSIFSIRICVYFVSGKSYFKQSTLQNKEADTNVVNKLKSDRTQVWIWVGTLPLTNCVNFSKFGVFVYKLKMKISSSMNGSEDYMR